MAVKTPRTSCFSDLSGNAGITLLLKFKITIIIMYLQNLWLRKRNNRSENKTIK